MILGLDWLETHSPMEIHWAQKWIQFIHEGHSVQLVGILPELPAGAVLHVGMEPPTKPDQSSWPPKIQALIQHYSTLFEKPHQLPSSHSCGHSIPLVFGATPVYTRPYRFSPTIKDEVERHVKEMLDSRIIQKSSSPFSSPVLLVKKKDHSWHFCVDYRHLNAITMKGKYPVPIIDELLDELGGATCFSKLDLRSGFHQILLKPGEEFKTAFQTQFGHFEFRVMPFGLTGAPGTFQEAMNSTLAPFLRKFVLVFFDDILIFSKSYEEHLQHLQCVFQQLQVHDWKIKLYKCDFAQRSIAYLGHVISGAGIATDPQKISAVTGWPSPTNLKELRGFLELAGYYHKFMRHFGIIAKPLTELLKKNALFNWTPAHEDSSQAVKTALSSSPVLSLPDFSKPFSIETDASATGIGAVLSQGGHPLAFLRKALGPRSRGLSTYEKEYMAVLLAVQHWRSYLQLAEFIIYTDQQSLVQLMDQRLHTPWQQKLFSKLAGLQFRIVYKPSSSNHAVDALSRKKSHDSVCADVSVVTPSWILEVTSGYDKDPATLDLIAKLSIDT
jgi:ribonuclease HI